MREAGGFGTCQLLVSTRALCSTKTAHTAGETLSHSFSWFLIWRISCLPSSVRHLAGLCSDLKASSQFGEMLVSGNPVRKNSLEFRRNISNRRRRFWKLFQHEVCEREREKKGSAKNGEKAKTAFSFGPFSNAPNAKGGESQFQKGSFPPVGNGRAIPNKKGVDNTSKGLCLEMGSRTERRATQRAG